MFAVFPLIILFELHLPELAIPPPFLSALLPVIMLFVNVDVPTLRIPPPELAVLPLIVLLVIVNVPQL